MSRKIHKKKKKRTGTSKREEDVFLIGANTRPIHAGDRVRLGGGENGVQ